MSALETAGSPGRSAAARALPYAAVALAACSWGSWAILIRKTDAIAPMPTALESTVVMAVITGVSAVTSLKDRTAGRAPIRARAWVAWLGVSDAFNVLLFFAAYKITIAVSVLAHYLTPILVALASPLVLRERVTARTSLAVAISFAGLALMLVPARGQVGVAAALESAALGAGSAVFYASNVVINKFVVSAFSTSETMFWHGVVATPLLAAFVPRAAWLALDARAVAFLAVASIGPGALAGIGFVWGLRRMPAAHASTLTLLEPPVAVLVAAGLYAEVLSARACAGGMLVLAGALLVMTQGARR
ncbi:MAG TPA: DMT family transporter [Polyangiaceae bacterium]|nr:DMT family transporter [Polyangiaceae bacterium]